MLGFCILLLILVLLTWVSYPFFALALFLVPHWMYHLYSGHYNRGFYIHLAMICVLDLMLFIIWFDSGKGNPPVSQSSWLFLGYPWFFYPILAFNIPLIIHWCCLNYPKTDEVSKKIRNWKIHSLLYCDINLMLFIAWALSQGFPWFVFIHIVWAPFLIVHWRRMKSANDNQATLPTQMPPQNTTVQAPAEMTQIPQYTMNPQSTVYVPVYQTQAVLYPTIPYLPPTNEQPKL